MTGPGGEPPPAGAGGLADRVRQALDAEINPAVAAHRGRVVLADVRQGWVRVRLEGGCQGCSLAEVTLRQGVEPRPARAPVMQPPRKQLRTRAQAQLELFRARPGAGAVVAWVELLVGCGRHRSPAQATGQVIMNRLRWSLAVVLVPAILGLAGLLVARAAPPGPAQAPASTAAGTSATPAPTHPASARPASGSPRASHPPRRTARPQRTGPWAVVTAYYRDITARRYARAWALISPGLDTGQSYAEFVAGYTCTGTERPAKLSQSGHRVSFRLTVTDNCTGAAQHYTGTDIVRGGKIVAAHVTRTS